jgi:DNA-binding CsgD family transcriptional regulator
MSLPLSEAAPEQLSDLIGAIYDCVLENGQWEPVLDQTRELLDCANCVLSVADMPANSRRALKIVGVEEPWLGRIGDYCRDITKLYLAAPDMHMRCLGEPFTLMGDIDKRLLNGNRYVREWGRPQGIVDSIQIFLMRDSSRNAALAFGRHQSAGSIGRREVELLRLLAPHFRRAVSISDLVDMQDLRLLAIGNALDALATAVVLVKDDGAVLHANLAARQMFSKGGPILLRRGRLGTTSRQIGNRLAKAIRLAAKNEAGIGDHGLGIALAGKGGEISTLHVLPLTGGEARQQFAAGAVAAVFVSEARRAFNGSLQPVAQAFALTAAETRMLDQLMRGHTLNEAACELGIARTTAKTHLGRIMCKTGTHRQADMISLVHRISPALIDARP